MTRETKCGTSTRSNTIHSKGEQTSTDARYNIREPGIQDKEIRHKRLPVV